MILNQTRSGKSCPRERTHLLEVVPEGSLMCFVQVHAWDLATVLDRLECLEDFQRKALRLIGMLHDHKSVD